MTITTGNEQYATVQRIIGGSHVTSQITQRSSEHGTQPRHPVCPTGPGGPEQRWLRSPGGRSRLGPARHGGVRRGGPQSPRSEERRVGKERRCTAATDTAS